MTEIQRHFLGWDTPFLPEVAKWLQSHYLQGALGTSDQLFILVPGQAVARRMQSILITEAYKVGRAVELPSIGTPQQLLKKLIPPNIRLADQYTVLLATITVLKNLSPSKLQLIIGSRPLKDSDFNAWCRIAKQVLETVQIASGGGLSLCSTSWPQEAQYILTDDAQRRFDFILEIQEGVQALLAECDLHLREHQHLELLKPNSDLNLGVLQHVVIAGASDLPGVATKLLHRLSRENVTVDALIRSPDSHKEGFNELGCIDIAYWTNINIDVSSDNIVVAGSPSSQSAEAVRALSELQSDVTSDQVTIVATDEDLIPILNRHIHGHGVQTRFAGGFPILQTPESICMYSIADFVSTQSYASYAAILRHPAMTKLFHIEEEVLQRLSSYSAIVVPNKINAETWFEPRKSRECVKGLSEIHRRTFDLFKQCIQYDRVSTTISQSASSIRDALLCIYGKEELDRTSPMLIVLQHIFGAIDQLERMPEFLSKRVGNIRVSDVIQFIMQGIEHTSIPELPNPDAIDTVGWLEGMVIDTPHIIVVGMGADLGGCNNPSDAFFPDMLLKALHLETIDRRMARDAHAVIAMQKLRMNIGSVKWIVGRKNLDGDPLSPSPLLMRCSDLETLSPEQSEVEAELLATRAGELVISFEREQPEMPPQFSPGEFGDGIGIPQPSKFPTKPLQQLSVTGFKDFLACSYRFWLKHVLKLQVAEEGRSELDAKLFGSYIHIVLQRFCEDESVKHSSNIKVIEKSVFDALDRVVLDQLGPNKSSKINIQLELARFRLKEFAKHQAESVTRGWTIVCTERFVEKIIEINEQQFTIRGVIDRVETNSDGRIRILDYKTGSTTANKAHFMKDRWIDLQLPLYRKLITEISELDDCDLSDENVLLGYFRIGDQETTSGIDLLSPPEKIASSLEYTISETIQSILKNEYSDSPAIPSPKFSDNYSWICQDNSIVEETSEFYG